MKTTTTTTKTLFGSYTVNNIIKDGNAEQGCQTHSAHDQTKPV